MQNMADITKLAMLMVPATESTVVAECTKHGITNPELVRSVVRAVNVENQYHNLKTAQFKLAEVARVTTPINPEVIIKKLGLATIGTPSAGSKKATVTFSMLKKVASSNREKTRKEASITAITAVSKDAYAHAVRLRKAASIDLSSKIKWQELRKIAAARLQENMGTIRVYCDRLNEVLAHEPEVCRKQGMLTQVSFTPNAVRNQDAGVRAVKEWAVIHKKLASIAPETRLFQFIVNRDAEKL